LPKAKTPAVFNSGVCACGWVAEVPEAGTSGYKTLV